MTGTVDRKVERSLAIHAVFALALLTGFGMSNSATAQESEAKKLLKAMSDYMAAQKAISFNYDTNLQVVTKDHQKIAGEFRIHRYEPAGQGSCRTHWRICGRRDCLRWQDADTAGQECQ